MPHQQLDLFAGADAHLDHTAAASVDRPRLVASELDDDALIAALPHASVGDSRSLAAEAGRRRLVGAIDALEALCRRFQGFGIEHLIPDQTAALQALATIGGSEAARAVTRIIVERIVQGPGLKSALEAAAQLRVTLPGNVVASLLRHQRSAIRASGCRCARPSPAVIPVLGELLDDADRTVASEAAVRSAGWAGPRLDLACCGCSARPPVLRCSMQSAPLPMRNASFSLVVSPGRTPISPMQRSRLWTPSGRHVR